MTREVMIKGDWWRQVQAVAHPQHITWQAQPMEVAVDFPSELHALLDKDPLLLQQLSDGGSEVYKAFIQECAGHVRWAEGLIAKAEARCRQDHDPGAYLAESERIHQGFGKLMSESTKQAEDNIRKGIMDAWKAAQKTKSDYRRYKIVAGVPIGLALADIGLSVARLVATFGTDVFAWRGAIKDLLRTGDELITLAQAAETVRQRAVLTIGRVADCHEKLGNGKVAVAHEVGLMLLRAVIGTSFNGTYAAAANDVKAYANKLGGLEAQAHTFAKKLQVLLGEMDRSRDAGTQPIGASVEVLQKQVADLIDRVIALQQEVRDGKAWAKDVAQLLVDLQKAHGISQVEKILKGIDTCVDVVRGVTGWVAFARDGGNTFKQIAGETVKLGKNVDRWQNEIRQLAHAAHA